MAGAIILVIVGILLFKLAAGLGGAAWLGN